MSDATDTVVLRAGDLEATWVPAAGMVGASLRHRGEELLGQRGGLAAYLERGSTFGIPLLHPWANRLGADRFRVGGREVQLPAGAAPVRHEEHGLPIHGLVAASPAWRVTAAERGVATARLTFGGDLLELFPFPHELIVTVALDERGLEVTTAVEAAQGAPVPIAFGWHPYLAPPGATRADWVLDLPARRHLLADDRGLPTGATELAGAERGPLGDRTFDDGYDELAAPVLAVEGGGRRLAVTLGDGYRVAQVFAPPGQDLVALEPMTAPTDALRTGRGLRWATAGEDYAATFRLDVQDAPPGWAAPARADLSARRSSSARARTGGRRRR